MQGWGSGKILIVLVAWTLGGGGGGGDANALEADEKPTKRLIGAKIIDIKFAPYTMQLRSTSGLFVCGGALIAPRYVVTAAHCLNILPAKDMVVVGNASSSNEAGVQRKIVQAFTHPGYYAAAKVDRDIAVLKLEGDMIGEYVNTIPLYDKSLEQGNTLQVYGWGLTSDRGDQPSEYLRTIRVPVVPQKECEEIYRTVEAEITDAMVCAFKPGEMDSCGNDSGGPAVFKGKLAGVVSWGKECGSEIYPGVYTRIDVTSDFIKECLKK